MNKHPIANALFIRGNNFIALGRYEDALQSFLKVLELDPSIQVPYRNQKEMEQFLEKGGRYILFDLKEISKREEDEALRQQRSALITERQNELTQRRQKEAERTKRQQSKENRKRQEEVTKRKREEARKRLVFNNNLSELIREIEYCANEIPCPKCNELEILILSLSPNARSLLGRCKHCEHEYRIKMEPADPQKLINLFNSFIEERSIFSDTKNQWPVWLMEIRKRQVANQRIPIPSHVKRTVWKRDNGKCVNCGSEVELEFDHIIPVSKGGSSTIQNIQVLCKVCNRKKHASIS